MDDENYITITNSALYKVREILWQAGVIHPDIPYTLIVSLLAESAMLADESKAWLAGLMKDTQECCELRMQSLISESEHAIHH